MDSKGITLAEIRSAKASVQIDLALYGFEGVTEPLTLYFKPTFWNDETRTKFSPSKETPEADPKSIEQINAEIVAESALGWDLTDNGEPLPVTVDTLRGLLGDAVTDGLLVKMIERVHPNRKSS